MCRFLFFVCRAWLETLFAWKAAGYVTVSALTEGKCLVHPLPMMIEQIHKMVAAPTLSIRYAAVHLRTVEPCRRYVHTRVLGLHDRCFGVQTAILLRCTWYCGVSIFCFNALQTSYTRATRICSFIHHLRLAGTTNLLGGWECSPSPLPRFFFEPSRLRAGRRRWRRLQGSSSL